MTTWAQLSQIHHVRLLQTDSMLRLCSMGGCSSFSRLPTDLGQHGKVALKKSFVKLTSPGSRLIEETRAQWTYCEDLAPRSLFICLQCSHRLYQSISHGRLYRALLCHPQAVLDLGSGDCRWAMYDFPMT